MNIQSVMNIDHSLSIKLVFVVRLEMDQHMQLTNRIPKEPKELHSHSHIHTQCAHPLPEVIK